MIDRGFPEWWAIAMVEPYVNLARLASLRGDTDRALRVFQHVYDCSIDGAPVDIEGYWFDTPRLTRLLQDLDGDGRGRVVVESSYRLFLQGSFRALVTAGRSDEAHAFVLDQIEGRGARRPPTGEYQDELLELRCLAPVTAGRHQEALIAADDLQAAGDFNGWAPVVAAILAAEARLWSDDRDEADRWWQEAVARLARLTRSGLPGAPLGYLLMRIAVGRMAADRVAGHRRLVEAGATGERPRDERQIVCEIPRPVPPRSPPTIGASRRRAVPSPREIVDERGGTRMRGGWRVDRRGVDGFPHGRSIGYSDWNGQHVLGSDVQLPVRLTACSSCSEGARCGATGSGSTNRKSTSGSRSMNLMRTLGGIGTPTCSRMAASGSASSRFRYASSVVALVATVLKLSVTFIM
jgi:hypothetical protein